MAEQFVLLGPSAKGESIGSKYDPPHGQGSYLTVGQKIYKALVDIPENEEWTPEHWTEVKVMDEIADRVSGPSIAVDEHVAIFDGTDGKVIKDSGFTIGKSVPSDAKFTDTTYESKPAALGGTDVSLVTTNDKYNWNNKIDSSRLGVANGVAVLDSSGKIATNQVPANMDNVSEYSSADAFPVNGQAGKFYVDTTTNHVYRWDGNSYVEIASSVELGETSTTAYRGDRGAEAYTHSVTNKGAAFASGFYKITTNSEGHVTNAVAIQKSDITGLGIPASDTTYSAATENSAGLMSAEDKVKLDGMSSGSVVYTNLDVTILPNMWTGSNPYTYTYTNSVVTENSAIFVQLKNGAGLTGYLSFNHTSAGVVFTTDETPFDSITVSLCVIHAPTESIDGLNAWDIYTDAVSGEVNVQDALMNLSYTINRINGLVSPQSIIPDDINYNVDVVSSQSFKVGKLVIISLTIEATSQLNQHTKLFSLPGPNTVTEISSTDVAARLWSPDYTKLYTIEYSGNVYNNENISANETVTMVGCYVTRD